MIKYMFCLFMMFSLYHECSCQIIDQYKSYEKEYNLIFLKFKTHIIQSIEDEIEVSDTSNLKFVLLNYILSDSPLDTANLSSFKKGEISSVRMNEFISRLKDFYQPFRENKEQEIAQHLSAIPLRLSRDKCIYEKLTPFQQANTFVYFDDRQPDTPIGYMLFLPKYNKSITAPRIWSWTLQFELGHWAFKSPMGVVGMEYLFSEGVTGPKPENRLEKH